MNTNVKYIVLMTIAMSLIWMVSAVVFMGMIETPNWTDIDPVKLALSSGPFLLVSFLKVLVFAWFVNRTHLTGFSLAFRVFFLLFGVMFFMTQIEIILVELPIEIPLEVVGVTAASGALATLGVAIMAVSYRRKLNPPASWGMWVECLRLVTELPPTGTHLQWLRRAAKSHRLLRRLTVLSRANTFKANSLLPTLQRLRDTAISDEG